MGYVGFSWRRFRIEGTARRSSMPTGRACPPVDHDGVVLPHARHALGSWWAYYELAGAAGGSGTRSRTPRHGRARPAPALIHRSRSPEARQLQELDLLLAISTFSLSLLGTSSWPRRADVGARVSTTRSVGLHPRSSSCHRLLAGAFACVRRRWASAASSTPCRASPSC